MDGYAVDPALASQMGFTGFGNSNKTNKRRKFDRAVISTTPWWAPAQPPNAYSPPHALPYPPPSHPLPAHPLTQSPTFGPTPQRSHWHSSPPHQQDYNHRSTQQNNEPVATYYPPPPLPASTYYQPPSPITNTPHYPTQHPIPARPFPQQRTPPQHPPYPAQPIPQNQASSFAPKDLRNPHNLPKPPPWPPAADYSDHSFRTAGPPAVNPHPNSSARTQGGHGGKPHFSKPNRSQLQAQPKQERRPSQVLPSWEAFPSGQHECDPAELVALRRGVRNQDGDVVYYLPSFVEDPWNRASDDKHVTEEDVKEKEIESEHEKGASDEEASIEPASNHEEQPKDDEMVFAVSNSVEDPWNRFTKRKRPKIR